MSEPNSLRIGTSAFISNGWRGTFYPEGIRPADYLSYYAKFDTVEMDSTLYGRPTISTVKAWDAKSQPGFIFAAKVPQTITHEKLLVDCDAEFKEFLEAMDCLGEKLGPLLFQLGFFINSIFRGVTDFLARLMPFLTKLPKDHMFVVEIRNQEASCLRAVPSVAPGFGMLPDRARTSRIAPPGTRTFVEYPTSGCEHTPLSGQLPRKTARRDSCEGT